MYLTITEFGKMPVDTDGNLLPLGGNFIASQTLTGLGAAAALNAKTRYVRIATDTGVICDVAKAGTSSELLPAGDVEFFAVAGGQVITFITG